MRVGQMNSHLKKTVAFEAGEARYTPVSLIPVSFLIQFRRFPNVYFAVMCIMSLFPFSPKLWWSAPPSGRGSSSSDNEFA